MAYPKYLSEKSLQKMYAQAGINEATSDFLHKFFLAVVNLSGSVFVRDLWEMYKEYSRQTEAPKLHRKDFVAFSAIARREKLPYYVFEIDEIYSEEPGKELDRCLVLKTLVGEGYGKFNALYSLHELQFDKPYYVPQDLLSYTNPPILEEEKELKHFLDNLKVTAMQSEDRYGKVYECEHTGKYLKDFEFLNRREQFDLEYWGGEIPRGPKRNQKKLDAIWESCRGPESEKILRHYKKSMMTGWGDTWSLRYLLDELNEVGVQLSENEFEMLVELINNFQNNSHLWCNCGWTPIELISRTYREDVPLAISFGPGIEQAIAEGKMDRDELVERLMEMGMRVL